MVKHLPLGEVPFLVQLPPDHRGTLHFDLLLVNLTWTEVFPKDGKTSVFLRHTS